MLPLRAAEGFHLHLERGPISAVLRLLDANLGIERGAEGVQILRFHEGEERAAGSEGDGFGWEITSQFQQQFRGAGFAQPKLNPVGARRGAVLPEMNGDEQFDNGPVFGALGFLGFHEVRNAQQMVIGAAIAGDDGAPLPEHRKGREIAQAGHDVDP